VFTAGIVRLGSPYDNSILLQLPQALGQERPRHQWYSTVNVIEAVRAQHQLAQDERRPTCGENLGRLRDRTELAVAGLHGESLKHVWDRATSPDCVLVADRRSADAIATFGFNSRLERVNWWRDPWVNVAIQAFRAGTP